MDLTSWYRIPKAKPRRSESFGGPRVGWERYPGARDGEASESLPEGTELDKNGGISPNHTALPSGAFLRGEGS